MIAPQSFSSRIACVTALLLLTLSGCAQDSYERRVDVIKTHVEDFYGHLKNNRVGAAVHENEQIEVMADHMAETVLKRSHGQGTTQAEREFALMKTARETAAQNWIALGQYFTIKQQPEKARASYRRVIDTYTDPTERVYREQAMRALNDVEIASEPVPSPSLTP
ncbi:MAG: hypothetical protein KF693_09280 [Nitrospira sp.]|nr:hypothetical protein [Nitrospira sp.]